MTVEVDNKGSAVSYLDPECLCSTTLSSTDNVVSFSVDYMLKAFEQYATKDLTLTAYLSTNHWIAVAIVPKQRKVYSGFFIPTDQTEQAGSGAGLPVRLGREPAKTGRIQI
jgi:hypothetical protein